MNARSTNGGGTIYIRADGSIDPPTAPIISVDNVTYTFTDDIYDSIFVERDNIVVDGTGHFLRPRAYTFFVDGLTLIERSNVTIRNVQITNYPGRSSFQFAIKLEWSSNSKIIGNNVTNNLAGIILRWSSNNSVFGNNIRDNTFTGIMLESSDNSVSRNNITGNLLGIVLRWSCNNTVSGNNVTDNGDGISVDFSSNNNNVSANNVINNSIGVGLYQSSKNVVSENNVTSNYAGFSVEDSPNNTFFGNNVASGYYGTVLLNSSDNVIYHNNFIDNGQQVGYVLNSQNVWDDGYPSGGNYWNNKIGIDLYGGPYQNETGSDGIADTPHIMDASNRDCYPLVNPWNLPDVTPPVTIISLVGVSGDRDWYTSDIMVTLSSGDVSGVNMREYSFDNIIWTTYTTSFNVTEEGRTIIYYKSSDKLGNNETANTKTVKIDKTFPSGGVTINSDTTYTTSISVTLTLTATDATSGVHRVRLSNDGVWDTESWVTPSPTKTWILSSGDGTKTVYYQVKDNAGLISTYSDTIIFDTTPPNILITSPSPGYEIKSSSVSITWTGLDETSGISHYEVRLDGNSWINTGTNTTYTFTGIGDGTHTVNLEAVDKAGNTKLDSVDFIVNTSPLLGPGYADEAVISAAVIITTLTLVLYFLKRRKH